MQENRWRCSGGTKRSRETDEEKMEGRELIFQSLTRGNDDFMLLGVESQADKVRL